MLNRLQWIFKIIFVKSRQFFILTELIHPFVSEFLRWEETHSKGMAVTEQCKQSLSKTFSEKVPRIKPASHYLIFVPDPLTVRYWNSI